MTETNPAAAPRFARQTHWPAVGAALAAGAISAFAYGKMSPALPLLKSQFGLTLVQAGWLVAAFNVLAAASAIFFGLFADRVGALRLCIAGTISIAAGGALGAFAQGAALLMASRLIEGFGFISVVVSAPGLIAAATAPARLGVAFGLWGSYLPFGVSVALVMAPALLGTLGWRSLWAASALGGAVCAGLLALRARDYAGVTQGARRSLASIRASLSQPVPWLLGIAFSVYAIQHLTLIVWLPTYLMEVRGASGTAAALATAFAVFANCFGNLLGGWLIQRGAARENIIALTFVATSVIFLGVFSPALPDALRYALAVCYSFITGTTPAAVLSSGTRYARSPAEVGAIQGLIVHITNVGIFIAPPLVAAVVTFSGSWDATLWVMLGCAAIALGCAFAVGRLERRSALFTSARH